jgi:hypothetical protein
VFTRFKKRIKTKKEMHYAALQLAQCVCVCVCVYTSTLIDALDSVCIKINVYTQVRQIHKIYTSHSNFKKQTINYTVQQIPKHFLAYIITLLLLMNNCILNYFSLDK